MALGRITRLIGDRGFGFLLPEENRTLNKDLFFHRSDVHGLVFEQLREGQQVEYDLGADERRGTTKATNVRATAQV